MSDVIPVRPIGVIKEERFLLFRFRMGQSGAVAVHGHNAVALGFALSLVEGTHAHGDFYALDVIHCDVRYEMSRTEIQWFT